MRLRRFAASGTETSDREPANAASYQGVAVDGYVPEPVIAPYQQVGIYRLPLASVAKQNNPGMLRHDGVESLDSTPNVYMPIWSAPMRGAAVNQVGGMVIEPINSYDAQQVQSNQFSANADTAAFIASLSPRYAGMSALSGE